MNYRYCKMKCMRHAMIGHMFFRYFLITWYNVTWRGTWRTPDVGHDECCDNSPLHRSPFWRYQTYNDVIPHWMVWSILSIFFKTQNSHPSAFRIKEIALRSELYSKASTCLPYAYMNHNSIVPYMSCIPWMASPTSQLPLLAPSCDMSRAMSDVVAYCVTLRLKSMDVSRKVSSVQSSNCPKRSAIDCSMKEQFLYLFHSYSNSTRMFNTKVCKHYCKCMARHHQVIPSIFSLLIGCTIALQDILCHTVWPPPVPVPMCTSQYSSRGTNIISVSIKELVCCIACPQLETSRQYISMIGTQ